VHMLKLDKYMCMSLAYLLLGGFWYLILILSTSFQKYMIAFPKILENL
jgi:hypothetical protein